MPGNTWDNESSYRRRILAILPVVIVLLASLVYVTRRMAPVDLFKMVGWRGEMELMPEITVIPDVPSRDASPAKTGKTAEETVALKLADAPGEFEPNPPRVESKPEEKVTPSFDNLDDVPSVREPERKPVPYSNEWVILRQVKPKYPKELQEQGIVGRVTVELLVNERGLVDEAVVVACLGPQAFAEETLEAVRQFEFQPPLDDRGRPTAFWVRFRVNFNL